MPVLAKAVIFDIDGVLLDSLPQHLKICRDKASQFGLKLEIPTVAEFRHLVSTGVRVSPMLHFFLAVGFPHELAEQADRDYRKEFGAHYHPKTFPGIVPMLAALRQAGLKLGLVTSNIGANVVPALGDAMAYFDTDGLFFFDRYAVPKSKAWCIAECARSLDVTPQRCVYVGDQPADAAAAAEAGTQFLGVTYGWGITKHDTRYRSVDSVDAIVQRLTEHRLPA